MEFPDESHDTARPNDEAATEAPSPEGTPAEQGRVEGALAEGESAEGPIVAAPATDGTFADEHLRDLREAKIRLELTPFLIRVANAVGRPLEGVIGALPGGAREVIDRATHASLEKGMDWAVATMGTTRASKPRGWLHTTTVTASGAVGGAFGWGALAAELPFSTVVMLRSIASIAQENGEDLRDAEARLQCLAVLSFGGPTPDDDAAETTYYATRTALTSSLQRTATHMLTALRGGDAPRAAQVVTRFVSSVAARFGIVVQEKVVAQAIPVVGSLGGATLNNLFIQHFQTVAHGHFTVRRLERIYGEEAVRAAYEAIGI